VPETLLVLDASVAIGWFFTDEPHRELALAVRAHLREAPDGYVVPSLFHSELVHVLARKSGRDAVFVESALRLVIRLGIRTLPLAETALVRTAHHTCRGLSGYDATYVALAEDLGGRWLTADLRAAKIAGAKTAQTLAAWAREHQS